MDNLVDTDQALANSAWLLIAIDGETADSENPAAIQFGGDGSISGTTGCNRMRGSYEVEIGVITFGPIITTRMACISEQSQRQERLLLTVLDGAVAYRVEDQDLRISTDTHILVFRAQPHTTERAES